MTLLCSDFNAARKHLSSYTCAPQTIVVTDKVVLEALQLEDCICEQRATGVLENGIKIAVLSMESGVAIVPRSAIQPMR
jgi:hypothetical protein